MPALSRSICDVPGIRVGHAQNDEARTGCTVIIPEHGAVAGVDVRGSAPGTREIEAIKPVRLVPKVHAVLLTGGSAFGLDAAGGVQQYLEEQGMGFDVGVATVPVVPTAVIFDLHEGDPRVRPDKQMGYQAAQAAVSAMVSEGRVGAGRGATVGKALGPQHCMKGGVGTACESMGEVRVGVLVVVNAVGNIVERDTGTIIAGARDPETGEFVDAVAYLQEHSLPGFNVSTNTTLALVATNAALCKEDATKIAEMAQDGIARVVRPAHTPFDGDLVIALSAGEQHAEVLSIGALAAELVAVAINRAVRIANEI